MGKCPKIQFVRDAYFENMMNVNTILDNLKINETIENTAEVKAVKSVCIQPNFIFIKHIKSFVIVQYFKTTIFISNQKLFNLINCNEDFTLNSVLKISRRKRHL